MHRFYFPKADFKHHPLILTDINEIHHLANVLRLKKGSGISIFNQNNEEGEGIILNLTQREMSVQINSFKKIDVRFPLITLACAIPKKSKFETIIEKATELGVHDIIPLRTKRTEVIFDRNREQKKYTRFQAIAINAAKQSKRFNIPHIHQVSEYADVLKNLIQHTKIIIPSLQGKRISLIDAFHQFKNEKRISFLIGPEGDFTKEEYELAHNAQGCIPVTLGETILKVETAAICVVACAKQFYS